MISETVRLPSSATIFRQQLLIVSGALRREASALAAALILLCLFAALGGLGRDPLVAEPNFLLFALPVAAFLPVAVWRGEALWGRAYLWTLPASRQTNAIARIVAGALCLVIGLLGTLFILAAIAWASGGQMGLTGVRLVSPTAELARAAEVRWVTPGWEYAAPFTAALTVYGLATAAILGLRHPLRWMLGILLAFGLLTALVLQTLPGTPLATGVEAVRQQLWFGPYGLDNALTGGNYGLAHEIELANDETTIVWSSLPSILPWLRSTAAWIAVTLILLALALRRHAER